MPQLTTDDALQLALDHHRAGRLSDAEAIYRQILSVEPNNAQALHWLGAIAHQTRHNDDALALLTRSLQINPVDPLTHGDLGETLKDLGRLDEAVEEYHKAIEMRPDLHCFHNDLGIVLRMQRRYAEALECFERAMRIDSRWPHTHMNLAGTLANLMRLDEALRAVDESLRIRPGHRLTVLTKSRILLLGGDLAEGLALYETRLPDEEIPYPKFAQPLWDGSDPRGRMIAVVAEQGLGDTLMCARFLPLLAARGGRVIFFCNPELSELLKPLPGVDRIFTTTDLLPDFDFHIPLLSLPHRLGTTLQTIPNQVPYVTVDPARVAKWNDKLAPHSGTFKIGLAWAGSPRHKGDKRRSMMLSDFAPLATVPGVTFFSLQKGEPAEQASHPPAGMRLVDLSADLADFTDTAAAIVNLDLVISVDTSIVHLAGALARPVWTLLPYEPDWRWMVHREDSPWYPTMRLYRQSSPGDWQGVMRVVRDALLRR